MFIRKFLKSKRLKSLVLTGSVCLLLDPALAATSVSWSGIQNNLWSEPLNWGGTVPTTGDIAVFTGNPLFQPLNDVANTAGVLGLDFSAATVSFTVSNAGTMTIGSSGIVNTSTLTHSIVNTGSLTLNGTVDPKISIQNDQNATLTIGTTSLSNVSVVNNGVLDISSATGNVTIGSLSGSGTISLGSHALTVSTAGQDTISGTINAASQQFIMSGSGTLTFTGTNNSSGNTRIDMGTLIIGDGASLAAGVENHANLIFDCSGTCTFLNNVISNTGTVQKTGIGTVTWNGSWNSSSGSLAVNNGTMALNSSQSTIGLGVNLTNGILLIGSDADHSTAVLTGNVTMSGGTLGGFGKVTGQVNNTAGILSPGASVGTITINGNYTQAAAGTYLVEISSDGNTADFTHITGTASLAGTLKFNLSSGFLPGHSYNILDAASFTGTPFFSTVTDTSNLPFTFFNTFVNGPLDPNSSVAYNTTGSTKGVSVTMPAFSQSAFSGAAITANQIAMSQYLLTTNGTGPIAVLIAGLSTPAGFQKAMDQLSGATYANQQWQLAQVGSWFTRQLSDRMSFYPESHDAAWSLWVTPYGSSAQLDSDNNASGLDTTMGGLAFGVDFPFAANQVKLGIAVASSYFDSDVTGNEDGSDTGWLYQIGVYSHYRMGSWNLAANADFGMTDQFDTTRNIVDATAGTTATVYGNEDSRIFSQAAKLSYDGLLGQQHHVRPFIGIVHQQVSTDAFTETGTAGYTLAVESSDYNSLKSQLGTSVSIPVSIVTFVGNVAWQHEFLDAAGNVDAHASSISNATTNPSIAGVDVGTDSALVKAGFVLFQTDIADLTVLYEGVFSDSYKEHGGKIQLNFNIN